MSRAYLNDALGSMVLPVSCLCASLLVSVRMTHAEAAPRVPGTQHGVRRASHQAPRQVVPPAEQSAEQSADANYVVETRRSSFNLGVALLGLRDSSYSGLVLSARGGRNLTPRLRATGFGVVNLARFGSGVSSEDPVIINPPNYVKSRGLPFAWLGAGLELHPFPSSPADWYAAADFGLLLRDSWSLGGQLGLGMDVRAGDWGFGPYLHLIYAAPDCLLDTQHCYVERFAAGLHLGVRLQVIWGEVL